MAVKKRTRRTVKAQRAIVGAPLEDIQAKRTMRPADRAVQRTEGAKDAKAKKAATKAKKAAGGQTGRIVSHQGSRGAQRKVAANTR